MKNKGLILFLFSFCLFMFSCSDKGIEAVQKGYLKYNRSINIGNALDDYQYFKTTEWTMLEDQQKHKIVNFKGYYNVEKISKRYDVKYADKNIALIVHFTLLDDDNFNVNYIEVSCDGKGFAIEDSWTDTAFGDLYYNTFNLQPALSSCNNYMIREEIARKAKIIQDKNLELAETDFEKLQEVIQAMQTKLPELEKANNLEALDKFYDEILEMLK